MDDRPSQFRQQRIPPGVPDRQLSKPLGKIFGEAMHISTTILRMSSATWRSSTLPGFQGCGSRNLDKFRTLPSSKATDAQQIGRLTNLMQLTVDTSWWTHYRSCTKNPDFIDTFAQAIRG
jgi:hypothetical protein